MMKYNPKFKKGDKVIISLPESDPYNAGEHIGEVEIVDYNGTWDNGEREPSYDILIHDFIHPSLPDKKGDCLCKHNTESEVKAYEDN